MDPLPRRAFVARYAVICLNDNTYWTGIGWSHGVDEALKMSLKEADELSQKLNKDQPRPNYRLDYLGLV